MRHETEIDYAMLSPQQKLQILKEMGFSEEGPLEHGLDCTSRQGGGLRCTCWPGTTSFKAPTVVKRYMGEDDEARQEFARRRTEYENGDSGKHPGLWVMHLEDTAPRYNS